MSINMDVCPLDKLLSLPRWPSQPIAVACNFRQRWVRAGIKEKPERTVIQAACKVLLFYFILLLLLLLLLLYFLCVQRR